MAKRLTPEEEAARVAAMWEIENSLEYNYIAGVDEAGRGPLAGAVYAAAVILPKGFIIPGINDSKKLSEKKREELFDVITANAVAYSIKSVDEKEIDRINILNAAFRAMNEAVTALSPAAEYVLVDGNRIYGMDYVPHDTVVKGDAKSVSIAAASILAKVSRDRYITEISTLYPEYGFAKHKGYGTKEHYAAIEKYGPCPIHRMTFLKKFYENRDIKYE